MTQSSLKEMRTTLNLLDQELIAILHKRAAIAHQIGAKKREAGAETIFAPVREAEIFARLRDNVSTHLSTNSLERIFIEIVSACRSIQGDTRLCILGEKHGWISAGALSRYGRAASYQTVDNIDDFVSALTAASDILGFASFAPQSSVDFSMLVEALFTGKLTIVEEFFTVPEFCVAANQARRFSEVQELYVTAEMLQLLRKFFISLPFNLKINICRSMAEACENLYSTSSVAALLPAAIARSNPDLCLLKSDLRSETLGAVKFMTFSRQPNHEYLPGLKTTLICDVDQAGDSLFEILTVLKHHGLQTVEVHSMNYTGKSWHNLLLIELMVPDTRAEFAQVLKELETKCRLVRSCGFYPVFKQEAA